MGSRHTFFAFPLLQDLLFVENQGIAVAIQHGLGTITIDEAACCALSVMWEKPIEANSLSLIGTR